MEPYHQIRHHVSSLLRFTLCTVIMQQYAYSVFPTVSSRNHSQHWSGGGQQLFSNQPAGATPKMQSRFALEWHQFGVQRKRYNDLHLHFVDGGRGDRSLRPGGVYSGLWRGGSGREHGCEWWWCRCAPYKLCQAGSFLGNSLVGNVIIELKFRIISSWLSISCIRKIVTFRLEQAQLEAQKSEVYRSRQTRSSRESMTILEWEPTRNGQGRVSTRDQSYLGRFSITVGLKNWYQNVSEISAGLKQSLCITWRSERMQWWWDCPTTQAVEGAKKRRNKKHQTPADALSAL